MTGYDGRRLPWTFGKRDDDMLFGMRPRGKYVRQTEKRNLSLSPFHLWGNEGIHSFLLCSIPAGSPSDRRSEGIYGDKKPRSNSGMIIVYGFECWAGEGGRENRLVGRFCPKTPKRLCFSSESGPRGSGRSPQYMGGGSSKPTNGSS